MTTIVYDREGHSMTADGHVGYSEDGPDLVCCAISSLMFTLAAALTDKGIESALAIRSGHMSVSTNRTGKSVNAIFDTIAAGFKLLSEKYPDHVIFKGGRQ